jgi:hypothetical protein
MQKPTQPDPEELAARELEAELANIERLRARGAALQAEAALFRAQRAELKQEIERLRAELTVQPPPQVKAPAVAPYVEADRWVAVHEAGHAVTARLLGMPVFKAVVRSNNSGVVYHNEPPTDLPAEREESSSWAPAVWCRDSMICGLGGAAAQLIDNPAQFSRSVPAGAFAGDADRFFEAAYIYLMLDGAPAAVWTQAAKDSGRGITKDAKAARDGWLKNPATVPFEIRQLYNELFSEAENLLRKNWDAVQRVAEALLESGELNEARIDELIGAEKLAEQSKTDETGSTH